MKKICESKGATACETRIVKWTNVHRPKKITNVVEKLSSYLA